MTVSELNQKVDTKFDAILAMLQAKAPAPEVPAVEELKPVSARAQAILARRPKAASSKAKSTKSAAKPRSVKKAAAPKAPELNAIEKLTHDDTSEEHFYGTEQAAIAYTESGPYAGNVRIATDGKGRPWSHKAENMIRLMDAIEALGGTATVRTICEQAITGSPENHK